MPQWSIDPSIPLLLDSSPGTRSRLMISMSSINAVLWMISRCSSVTEYSSDSACLAAVAEHPRGVPR